MSTSMSIPNLLFAGKLRTEAALAANRSNSFMAALIAGAGKQGGPMPWANPVPANEAGNEGRAIEFLAKMAIENDARAAKILADRIEVKETPARTSVLHEWRSAEATPGTHCRTRTAQHHRRSVAGQRRPDRSRSHRWRSHGWNDGSGANAISGTSQFASASPLAGPMRTQAAVGTNRDNTFMAALLSSTERQSRQQAWAKPIAANQALANQALANQALAPEVQPDRAFASQTLAEEALADSTPAMGPIASAAPAPTPILVSTQAPAVPRAVVATEEAAAEENVANLITAEDVVAQTRVIPPPPRKQTNLLFRAWSWLNRNYSKSSSRQLRVAETISLGDKRFVAVVQVEGRKFLIGGGAAGVSLLTHLGTANDTQATPGAAIASGVMPE